MPIVIGLTILGIVLGANGHRAAVVVRVLLGTFRRSGPDWRSRRDRSREEVLTSPEIRSREKVRADVRGGPERGTPETRKEVPKELHARRLREEVLTESAGGEKS